VRGLQKSQLHHDKEQEEAYRTDGNEEVLQYLPEADGAQRS
jgi:type II secretory pathway component PulL